MITGDARASALFRPRMRSIWIVVLAVISALLTGMKYSDLTLEPLRSQIRDHNLAPYGDEWRPTIGFLRQEGKTWEEIIESSLRPGGKDFGF